MLKELIILIFAFVMDIYFKKKNLAESILVPDIWVSSEAVSSLFVNSCNSFSKLSEAKSNGIIL